MKFDASRAASFFRELGDPLYSGHDGEARVADLVAGHLAAAGFDVERREVTGSRFPQGVAPWVGWLGYGALMTAVYGLILVGNIFLGVAALILTFFIGRLINGVVGDRIRIGRTRPPMQKAPLVLAATAGGTPAPTRVVFLALLGQWKLNLDHRYPWLARVVLGMRVMTTILTWATIVCELGLFFDPDHVGFLATFGLLTRFLFPALLAVAWMVIVIELSWEWRTSRSANDSNRPDRHGLAVLLEIARAWPKSRSRPLEPIFVAAGGERIDHAGCREVGRLLGSEWNDRPALLVLLLAPGAGESLGLFAVDSPGSEVGRLAHAAARSLWIPVLDGFRCRSFPFRPFEVHHPSIALLGSEPRSFFDDTVDPQALHCSSQLATEIALRWARKHDVTGAPESAA